MIMIMAEKQDVYLFVMYIICNKLWYIAQSLFVRKACTFEIYLALTQTGFETICVIVTFDNRYK